MLHKKYEVLPIMNQQHSTTNGAENHHNPTLVSSPYAHHKDKYFQDVKSNRFSQSSLNRKGKKPEKSSTLKGEDFFGFFSFNDSKQQCSIQNQHVKDKFEIEQVQNSIFAILRKRLSELELQKSNCDEVEEDIEITTEISKLEKRLDCLNGCSTRFIGIRQNSEEKHEDVFMGMKLFCGNVLCAECNAKGSSIHKRKVVRAKWLVESFPEDVPFGYLVFTIPKSLRKHFVTRNRLNELFRIGIETVKDVLAPIGMLGTLHFHGEKEVGFHPHLNVVFPRESSDGTTLRMLLPKSVLKKIRQEFMLKLLEVISEDAKGKFIYQNPKYLETKTNVHYKFKSATGQKVHCLKYCLRGTDVEKIGQAKPEVFDLFLDLAAFRNVRFFGEFSNSKKGKFLERRGIALDSKSDFANQVDIVPKAVGESAPKLFSFMDNPVLGSSADFPQYPLVDLQDHWTWLGDSHTQLVKSLVADYGKAIKLPYIKQKLIDWDDAYKPLMNSSEISDGPLLVVATEKLTKLLRFSAETGGQNAS